MISFVEKGMESFKSQRAGIKYFLLSCFVTVVDCTILFVLRRFFDVDLCIANTIAVVSGFVLHYAMGSKTVFKTPYGIMGFLVYLVTFLFGLYLADLIVVFTADFIIQNTSYSESLAELCGKALSIVLPFFILYYLRKFMFDILNKRKSKGELK